MADLAGARAWFRVAGVVCAGMGLLGFLIPPVMDFEGRVAGAGKPLTT
jgi:hypothetical protein